MRGTILWIIAVILAIVGIVQLIQGQIIFGVALIVAGCIVGPGGYSLFSWRIFRLQPQQSLTDPQLGSYTTRTIQSPSRSCPPRPLISTRREMPGVGLAMIKSPPPSRARVAASMRTRSPLESMNDTPATSTVTSPVGRSASALARSGAV